MRWLRWGFNADVMKGGLIPRLLNYFHFLKKKLLTRKLVFAITDIRKGEMLSDINREELKNGNDS